MQSPEFDGFDRFAPPFGLILYYIFTFVVMVILLNILIALYNSAYEDITDNAIDEYMALVSLQTTLFFHLNSDSPKDRWLTNIVCRQNDAVCTSSGRKCFHCSVQPYRALLSRDSLRMVDASRQIS